MSKVARGAGLSLVAFACLVSIGYLAAQQRASDAPAISGPGGEMTEAAALLKKGEAKQAFALLAKVLAADRDNAAANLLAASAAIALDDSAQAVTYAERARALEPDNWKPHTTLVVAYAMAGNKKGRDAERTALHRIHESGKISDASETAGFLVDIFRVKQYRIEAVEYFAPIGKFRIYYRFLIRDSKGQRVWKIDAQSDDYNQLSWAKAYPKRAAEGQRQFQITGEGNGVRVDYRSFSGSADYDWIREQIIEIVSAQSAPFPGEPG